MFKMSRIEVKSDNRKIFIRFKITKIIRIIIIELMRNKGKKKQKKKMNINFHFLMIIIILVLVAFRIMKKIKTIYLIKRLMEKIF